MPGLIDVVNTDSNSYQSVSALAFVGSAGFLIWSEIRFLSHQDSIVMLLIALSLGIFALVFFTLCVIVQQSNIVQRELWLIRQKMAAQEAPPMPEQDANAH